MGERVGMRMGKMRMAAPMHGVFESSHLASEFREKASWTSVST